MTAVLHWVGLVWPRTGDRSTGTRYGPIQISVLWDENGQRHPRAARARGGLAFIVMTRAETGSLTRAAVWLFRVASGAPVMTSSQWPGPLAILHLHHRAMSVEPGRRRR